MVDIHPNFIFLAGLIIIILGAELLLRGASRLATILGVPPIVIGLTIVSVGTSAPELAVGITAVREGRGILALGNIAGTNIFNIMFILGLSAVIRPLPIRLLSIRLDVPVMIAAALALIVMAWDGILSRWDGLVLLAASLVYTVVLIRLSRKESHATKKEFAEEYGKEKTLPVLDSRIPHVNAWRVSWNILLFVVGLALTLFGADLLVSGAASIARLYGVTDATIGLTIVAIGTSAPELATTLLATLKNDRDVAVGNLIGSSIYNILVILGATCFASSGGIKVSPEIFWIDLPLAAATALICLPVFKSDRLLSRTEGGLFVVVYLIYLTSVVFIRGGNGGV